MNDGAAALVITTEERAAKLGRTPVARIAGHAVSGIEPAMVMMAPVQGSSETAGQDRMDNGQRGSLRTQ